MKRKAKNTGRTLRKKKSKNTGRPLIVLLLIIVFIGTTLVISFVTLLSTCVPSIHNVNSSTVNCFSSL